MTRPTCGPSADQIEQWVEDILAAEAELRRQTGVRQVCLLGMRLGALLATLAAARLSNVKGMIFLAPVTSGKRYLRELRTARLAAIMGTAEADRDVSLRRSRHAWIDGVQRLCHVGGHHGDAVED